MIHNFCGLFFFATRKYENKESEEKKEEMPQNESGAVLNRDANDNLIPLRQPNLPFHQHSESHEFSAPENENKEAKPADTEQTVTMTCMEKFKRFLHTLTHQTSIVFLNSHQKNKNVYFYL